MIRLAGSGPSTNGDRRDPPDEVVVRRILNGDPEEYEVLVRRYQERLHRFALGMVGDPDAAGDLVQESLVTAYTNLENCRKPSRFGAWVHQILRNRCRDFLKNVRRSHEPLDDHPGLVTAIPGPAAELDRGEARRTLRGALAGLPDEHREAFLLKHLQGYSYPEIAEMVGASVSAVKMRVHRSREMLRSKLGSRAGRGSDVTIAPVRSSSR